MKTLLFSILLLITFAEWRSSGQPIFLYDQQSALEGTNAEGGGIITTSQPFGQSFTPSLDLIGFVRLWVDDLAPGNGIGSTVYVNLRTNSISGPILGSSDAIFLPDGFGVGSSNRGYPNFFFSTPLPVTPGVTYYLQPVLQSGDVMGVFGDIGFNYGGGTMFIQGSPSSGQDLWFREGIVVPEPSSVALALSGAALLAAFHWRKRSRPLP